MADGDSEFDRLVAQLVPHEPSGYAALPEELVRNAAVGALLLLAGAAFAFALVPAPESVEDGGFFIVGAEAAASWSAVLKAAAAPLAAVALLFIALDAYLWQRRPSEEAWRYVCVAQPFAGVGSLGAWGLFGLAVLVNLALWVFLIGAVAAAVVLGLALFATVADG